MCVFYTSWGDEIIVDVFGDTEDSFRMSNEFWNGEFLLDIEEWDDIALTAEKLVSIEPEDICDRIFDFAFNFEVLAIISGKEFNNTICKTAS